METRKSLPTCLGDRRSRRVRLATLCALALLLSGCASNSITLRSAPKNPLGDQLQLTSWSGPRPSPRTEQLLRVHNLTYKPGGDPRPLIRELQGYNLVQPAAERAYAMAELAYLGGKNAEKKGDAQSAINLYGESALHAYQYLFDKKYAATRNPYDPEYRGACDIYNSSLEAGLRIANKEKTLVPGVKRTINTASGPYELACEMKGTRWQGEKIERLEFASDYEVKGLKNLYQIHGLGVPMIAVRKSYAGESIDAKYYPPDLSFPVTALIRPTLDENGEQAENSSVKLGTIELYDPLEINETQIANHLVPLESDYTTPLAYFLSKPQLDVATVGLLQPDKLLKQMRPNHDASIMGLYMTQPYERGKIPVIMVHGLWSSPMTWMEMFNDLRSSADIRNNYQFWFYLYPTAQPFWISSMQLRNDLARMREDLDPSRTEPALDQMVLIGHSMGGLVAKMQTVESRDDYWKLVSSEPIEQLKLEPEVRDKLRQMCFFEPNPSVRRVITIATPHRGSTFSNQTTQWMLGKLISLPDMLVKSQQKIYRDNPKAFPADSLIKVETSIDSLSPKSPILPVLLSSHRLPWVKFNNIVGNWPGEWWTGSFTKDSDGVVSTASAHLDDAESEITVPADHTTVHTHPAAVLEVHRILLAHLADVQMNPTRQMVEGAPQYAPRTAPIETPPTVPAATARRPSKEPPATLTIKGAL